MFRLCARVLALALFATLAVPLLVEPAAAEVAVSIETPTDIAVGSDFEEFTATTSAGAGDLPTGTARREFVITGPSEFDAADIELQVDPDGPGTGVDYQDIVLTDTAEGEVRGTVGPDFDTTLGFETTEFFRIAANLGAPVDELTILYAINAVLLGNVTGTPATGQDTTAITAPGLTVDLPESIGVGGSAVGYSASLVNATGSDYAAVRVDFTITGPEGFDVSDLIVEYLEGDTWLPLPLENGDPGMVIGTFGPAGGFPMPNGYNATTQFRVAANLGAPVGDYTLDSDLVRVDEGTPASPPIVTTTDTMAVAAPAITFALPAQLAVGADPAEFSGTVINDTGSDYAAVRYDITIDGPPDLVAADLLVEYDSDGAGTFLPLTLTDDAGVITTFFGPAGGFPLPDGASFLTDFRVTVLTGAPTGAVTVTVDLVVIDEGPVEPPIVTLVNESEIVAAPGVSVTTPAMLVRGAAPSGGNVTISPPAVGDYSGVNLEIRFTGASALDVGDVGVAYVDPNATGTPLTSLELTEDGDDLVGTIPNSGTINLPDQSGDYDFIISATSGAPLGTLTMTATFLRGAEELGQASDTSEIVEVDPTTTTVALTVAPNPANPGQPVTLTATVDAVADVAPPPTGTVHFRVYGTEVGSAAIDANGVATLVLGSGLPLGTYLVTADFDANPPFTDSTSNVVTFTEQLPTRLGRFIDSVYLGVLQRHVDPAGLSYWTDQINRTGDRNTFTFAMLFSDEVRARNCTNFYQYYLGRTPDTPGLLYCIGLLQQGLHLDDVETTITGSAEYLGLAGGTNNGFLDRLYAQVLGRPIDPAARAFYLQALADGAPRAFVSATVLQSDERSGIFVESAYQTILGRVSDPLGKAYWVGQLANRVREEALIGLLYGSDEYFNKIS